MFGSFELSTRELSTLIWTVLFLAWAFTNKPVRDALYRVISCLLNIRLQIILCSHLLWIVLCCFGLYKFGFWKDLYTKEVLLWTLFSGLSLTGNSITKHEIDLYKEIKVTFTVTAIFGLFLSMHSFELWIELVLVPSIAIMFGIHAMAGTRGEWRITKKVFDWILGFLGLFYFGFYCWYFFEHFSVNELQEQVEVILIILTLTVFLLPLLYFWAMYSMYEQLFNLFNMYWFKDKQSVAKYAKRRIFRHCFFSYYQLKALCKNPEFRGGLFNAHSRDDINQVFRKLAHQSKQYGTGNDNS